MAKQIDTSITPNTTVKLTIKEFIAVIAFVISIGFAAGGYYKTFSEFREVSNNLDEIKSIANTTKVDIGSLTSKAKVLQTNIDSVRKKSDLAYNQCITCDKKAIKNNLTY